MNMMRTQGKTAILVALVAALAGFVNWSAVPAAAQQGIGEGASDAVAIGWDLDNDGAYDDAVSFATFLKSGQLIADGITLTVTDNNCPVRLGNGHGTWRYRQQDQSLLVRTLHATQPNCGACGDTFASAVWEITGILTHTTGGRFEGKATIKQFASLDDFRAGKPPVWTGTVGWYYDFSY